MRQAHTVIYSYKLEPYKKTYISSYFKEYFVYLREKSCTLLPKTNVPKTFGC